MDFDELGSLGQGIVDLKTAYDASKAALAKSEADLAVSRAINVEDAAENADLKSKCAALTATVTDLQGKLAALQTPAPFFLDDFTGTTVDTAKWKVRNLDTQSNQLGGNLAKNATVANGQLVLRCQRETVTVGTKTLAYSNAYLDTIGKPTQRYGVWSIRCRLPKAKGAWPAFWLRDNALPGEIDVMEAVSDGKGGGKLVMTVHQDTNGGAAKKGFEYVPPAGWDWAGLHLFAVSWDGKTLTWLVDGKPITSVTLAAYPWLATSFGPAGLNMRLNYQSGGSMPNYYGLPMDATSVLPDDFVVDQVLVTA